MATGQSLSSVMAKPKRQARQSGDGPWFWIHKDSWAKARTKGGPTCALVYAALCHLESDSPVKERFYANLYSIADLAGVSTRSVDRQLVNLAKRGLIRVESGKGKGKKGAHIANRYTILSPTDRNAQAPTDTETEALAKLKHVSSAHIKEPPSPSGKKEVKENKAARPSAVASGASPSADAGLAPATAAGLEERSPFGHLSDEARKFMEGEE